MTVALAALAAINPATGNPLRRAADPARPGNINKARELLSQLIEFDAAFGAAKRDEWNLAREEARYTKAYAVEQNGAVIDLLRELRTASRSKAQQAHTVPSGRYAVDNAVGDLAFYRVVVGDNGFTKVQVYASDTLYPVAWAQALPILRKIEAATPAVAAKTFGVKLGRCFTCGRTLTDALSRERGQGPDCSKSR